MGMTSLYFITLSVLSIFIYYLLRHKYRAIFLTLLSCAFIATYSYYLLLYVIAYSLINYSIGIRIPSSRLRKLLFLIGIIINLLQLILLKYVLFTISPLFEILNFNIDLLIISNIIIPIGVSFFTLQGMGYLINVYIGWEKPEKNFIHFLLYIIFYPRFISGPIDRSNRFLPQLKEQHGFNEQKVIQGLRLVMFGLFKKVAIANQLASVVNSAYYNLNTTDENSLWIILLIQPLYLYFDFSGYTDIAFGIARTYGLELRPNFNSPFVSESMTEFWKRFHISLSSWFHDYIFVRTVFKYRRWGKNASIFALFLTWSLFGIWHGAGWNFMLLGLLQALAIYYEFLTKRWRVKVFSILPKFISRWIGRLCTYLFFCAALVFFFAPDLESVFHFFSQIPQTNGIIPQGINRDVYIMVIVFILIFLGYDIIKNDFCIFYKRIISFWFSNKSVHVLFRWTVYFALITIILVMNKDVQEFIYLQF